MRFFPIKILAPPDIIKIVLAGAFDGEREIRCRRLDLQLEKILEEAKEHPLIENVYPYGIGTYARDVYLYLAERSRYIKLGEEEDIIKYKIRKSAKRLKRRAKIRDEYYNSLMALGRKIRVIERDESQ